MADEVGPRSAAVFLCLNLNGSIPAGGLTFVADP